MLGARETTAARACGQGIAQFAPGFVDLRYEALGRPDPVAARPEALQEVNGAMACANGSIVEPGALELSVDVAGEDRATVRHRLAPALRQRKAGVRHGLAIQREPVPVEAPSLARPSPEGGWRCDGVEIDAGAAQCGVGVPESLRTEKVGQARIHGHARSGGHQQAIGLRNQRGGLAWGIGGRHGVAAARTIAARHDAQCGGAGGIRTPVRKPSSRRSTCLAICFRSRHRCRAVARYTGRQYPIFSPRPKVPGSRPAHVNYLAAGRLRIAPLPPCPAHRPTVARLTGV